MVRKEYFKSTTKSQILKREYKALDEVPEILNLNSNQYTIISPLVPQEFDSARKFMKHAPEVLPKRQYSVEQAIREGLTPVQLREMAFNKIQDIYFSGYSFLPLGRDRRKRKISLVESLEGARIFAYANQTKGAGIKVRPYHDAKRVKTEGAEIVLEVPSRTEKNPRHRLKLTSVPIVDSPEKYAITMNLGSDHSCPSKRFNIRYRFSEDKEASGIVNLCAHEIAGYFSIIDYFWNNEKNIVPLQMSQIAIPTRKTANFYLNLENSVLVEDENLKVKDNLRKMNRAEKEIALWSFVRAFGHDKTFFPKMSQDGSLADYEWK